MTTIGATDIAASSATLNGNLSSMGTADTVNVCFLWGTDQNNLNFETQQQELTAARSFNFDLSGLNPNTTFYYQAKADGGAHGTSYGSIMSFTTSKIPPVVYTNTATDVLSNSAVLHGTLQNLGTATTVNVSFQYGTTSGMYSDETTPQSMALRLLSSHQRTACRPIQHTTTVPKPTAAFTASATATRSPSQQTESHLQWPPITPPV